MPSRVEAIDTVDSDGPVQRSSNPRAGQCRLGAAARRYPSFHCRVPSRWCKDLGEMGTVMAERGIM